MIPIRDTIPSSRVPVVNYLLIAANLGFFFYEVSLGESLPPFLERYALIPARFLGGGVLSFRVQTGFQPASTVPNVGASGAIAGVLGSYFFLFPRARVVTLLPLFIFFTVVEIPAVVFLGLWFLIQFLSGTVSLGRAAATGGVAWWAHVGGFLAGIVLLKMFTFPGRRRGHMSV